MNMNRPKSITANVAGVPTAAAMLLLVVSLALTGCLGGRFKSAAPTTDLDRTTGVVVDALNIERAARHLPAANLVPELRSPAVRGALAVARGDQSLKTAAHFAAELGVTDLGRHVWAFATDCTDLQRFRPPALALQQRVLLLGAAAVPGLGGKTAVLLVIADPGSSSLRADQMGGGPGGTNPSTQSYAHSSVATGACGETWPAAQRAPL